MNTIEQNKLIAEFMGWNPDRSMHTEDELKYHTSWDWLMSVVKKIELIDSYQMTRETMKNIGLSIPKIELVYEYVVQFITWYNENK